MNGTDVQSTLRDMWETRPARPREGAQLGGVAAAIGRRYAVDPVLVRVGFVVTAFYGIGALLYLAGWALLPDEQAERPRDRPRTLPLLGLTAATLGGAGALFGSRGGWLLPTLGALGLLFLLHRHRAALPAAPAPSAAEAPTVPTPAGPPGADPAVRPPAWDPLGAAPFAWDLPEPAPPPPPAPRRAPVTAVTLAAALIAGGATGLALLAGGGPGDLPVLFGVVLAVLGTGLVVGSFLRAGRGLVPVALLMSVLTWGVVAAPWDRFEDGAGDVRLAPASAAAIAPRYEHGAGTFELDLRGIALDAPPAPPAPPVPPIRTEITVGAGDVRVFVPRNADVTLRAEAGLGRVAFGEREDSGPGASLTVTDLGADGVASGRPIELVVEAGVGNVEVRRG